MAEQRSWIYLGLAGETGRGRVVQSGLYRMADGGDEWEALHRGLPEAPAVRALAVHPLHPEIVYAGTQSGPYRSDDRGEHWEKINIPDHGLPVWSFLFHPYDPERDLRRLRELRDLSQRRRRRTLDPSAGQRALSRHHHRTRLQPGQARADAGCQRERAGLTCTPPSRSAAPCAPPTAASIGKT